ncbi:MAG: YtxH domain-containing protein [Bacteroidia bacterium]
MSGKKMLGALLIAAAVGVTVGVLTAPGKGKDTRKKIKNKANDTSDRIKRKFTDLVDEMKCEIEELKEKAKDYSEKGWS